MSAEPKIKVGDRVRIVHSRYSGHESRKAGGTGVVTAAGPPLSALSVNVDVDESPAPRETSWSFFRDELEVVEPAPVPAPIAVRDRVRLTTDYDGLKAGHLGTVFEVRRASPYPVRVIWDGNDDRDAWLQSNSEVALVEPAPKVLPAPAPKPAVVVYLSEGGPVSDAADGWYVTPQGDLDVTLGENTVATFARGAWLSVRGSKEDAPAA